MGSDRGTIITSTLLGLSADEGETFLENKSSSGIISFLRNSRRVLRAFSGGLALRNFDGYTDAAPVIVTAAVTTTDATTTNIWSLAVPTSGCVGVAALVVGKRVGANADGVTAFRYNGATNNAGTVALVGTTGGSTLENSSGTPVVDLVADDTDNTIELQVTGIAAQTYAWTAFIIYSSVVSSS